MANAHATRNPLFEATAAVDNIDAAGISIGRREILQQGTSFINSIDGLFDQLKRPPMSKTRKAKGIVKRMGVTVFYFEEGPVEDDKKMAGRQIGPRKNLRRSRIK
jgi:hypothetical protein